MSRSRMFRLWEGRPIKTWNPKIFINRELLLILVIQMIDERYIAGYFDADGCAFIVATKEKHYKRVRFRPFIKIAHKYREILEIIRDYLGVGYVTKGDRNGKYYVYFIDTVKDAEVFIERIMPYTIVKRKVLEALREYVEICKKYGNTPHNREVRIKILEIREKIHRLNMRTKRRSARLKYTKEELLSCDFKLY